MGRATGSGRVAGAHVALLRGVNVGGRNSVSMELVAGAFTELGCGEVRTYIQSGNVVFRAPRELADRLPELAAERIARGAGLRPAVLVRSAEALRKVVRGNPYGGASESAALQLFGTIAFCKTVGIGVAMAQERSFAEQGFHGNERMPRLFEGNANGRPHIDKPVILLDYPQRFAQAIEIRVEDPVDSSVFSQMIFPCRPARSASLVDH